MRSIRKKILASTLAAVTMISMVACGGNSSSASNKGEEKKGGDGKYSISGTVNYALPTVWLSEDRQIIIDKFKERYPNIEVNVTKYDSDTDTYLTTAVATGETPDIVEGWNPLIYPLSTGLVQPLDEFLEKDDDVKNVPENIMNNFKIDDKTYAVPTKTVTEGVILNLDLLDTLNLDKPEYDWSIDDFKDLLKKSTNDKYSGIDNLYVFRTLLAASFDKDLAIGSYNYDKEKFDFTSGAFQKQMDVIMELRAVPGLQSESLKNKDLTDQGKEDDYQKKFGKEVNAFDDGKQLMKGAGTWDLNNIKPKFNWDFYTQPSDPAVGHRMEAEADFVFMLNTTKDKEAAYEFLKWISFGEEGVLATLEARDKVENPVPYIYLPVTQTSAIKEKIEESKIIPEGLKYFYNNLDKGYGNPQKVIPGYLKAVTDVLHPTISQIFKGETNAAAVAPEMEEKANKIIEENWNTLRSQMSDSNK